MQGHGDLSISHRIVETVPFPKTCEPSGQDTEHSGMSHPAGNGQSYIAHLISGFDHIRCFTRAPPTNQLNRIGACLRHWPPISHSPPHRTTSSLTVCRQRSTFAPKVENKLRYAWRNGRYKAGPEVVSHTSSNVGIEENQGTESRGQQRRSWRWGLEEGVPHRGWGRGIRLERLQVRMVRYRRGTSA
ncbi:hypothetical protein BC826DRAFT_325195 [Russula brevipes]|nr:hypothetical protein BC826DRAFT_325195 [Russula brevipes]